MCSGCGMKFVRDNEQNNLIMRKNCNNESILSEGVDKGICMCPSSKQQYSEKG